MLVEFTCVRCGAKFLHEPRKNGGLQARFCPACRRERLREQRQVHNKKLNAERKRQRAEARAASRVVLKCRRCGTVFEQSARPSMNKISSSSDAYVLRSYCPSCTWMMKRAARACDPRYSGVGGHSDILEYGTSAR